MKTSLQNRIFYLVSVLMISSMLFISVVLLSALKDRMSEEFRNRGTLIVKEFSEKVTEAILIEDRTTLDKFSEQLLTNKDILYLQIYGKFAVKLFEKKTDEKILINSQKPTEDVKSFVVKNVGLIRNNIRINTLDIYTPVFYEGALLGFVRVGISLEEVDSEVTHQLIITSVFVLCFLVVGLFISLFFSRSLSKPLIRLTEAAHEFSKGNLGFKVKIDTKDEIGELAGAFNKMTEDLRKTTVSRDELVKEVTERKHAEEELKTAYEQLKNTEFQLVQSAKMASVGQLAGGVAHEINNPLTGVLNNVQLIRVVAEEQKTFNMDNFKELLGVIESSAVRCQKITQSLLDFSRTSKGLLQPLSLNELIGKVINLVEHELKLQNVYIQNNLQVDLPKVIGDSQLLQQVVFDIITNARWAIQQKAQKENGLITIKTVYEPGKKNICLYISDTGIGISKDNLEHIFEPFFTTKPVGEGTGLGLSIVYNIVKAHQGTIEAESDPGKGSTFKICFPAA